MIPRHSDWPRRLGEAIDSARLKPFQYGEVDCCLFPADSVLAMGLAAVDVAAPFRGKYSTERGAIGQLKRFAGGGVRETLEKLASQHGAEIVPRGMLQRGDTCLMPADVVKGQMGVVDLTARFVVMKSGGGLASAPISSVVMAWRF